MGHLNNMPLYSDARYSSYGPPNIPKCDHNSKEFECESLSQLDINKFHSVFYPSPSKFQQVNFIMKHVNVVSDARRRPEMPKITSTSIYIKENRWKYAAILSLHLM